MRKKLTFWEGVWGLIAFIVLGFTFAALFELRKLEIIYYAFWLLGLVWGIFASIFYIVFLEFWTEARKRKR
jgi:disulfide bond formation protein DsbB